MPVANAQYLPSIYTRRRLTEQKKENTKDMRLFPITKQCKPPDWKHHYVPGGVNEKIFK